MEVQGQLDLVARSISALFVAPQVANQIDASLLNSLPILHRSSIACLPSLISALFSSSKAMLRVLSRPFVSVCCNTRRLPSRTRTIDGHARKTRCAETTYSGTSALQSDGDSRIATLLLTEASDGIRCRSAAQART